MYEYTDKVIFYLNKEYASVFSRLKGKASKYRLAKMDELTLMKSVEEVYKTLMSITRPLLLQIANHAYHKHAPKGSLSDKWFTEFLGSCSLVTKYIFLTEVDRKRSRLLEALIATRGDPAEVEMALTYWSKMVAEYAVEITDAATLQALKDMGVTKVKWYTEKDERVCKTCRERHGKIYPIDEVPAKPHWGCRCYIVPYTK